MKLRTPAALLPLLLFVLTGAATLRAQQPATDHGVTAAVPATPAPAPAEAAPAPTPKPSPLFEQADDRAPTLAAAQKADAETRRSSGRHTVTMSTTVLILVVVILVLLID